MDDIEVAMPNAETIKWFTQVEITTFLEKRKERLRINDKDIKKITDQKVDGKTFLLLSKQDLLAPPLEFCLRQAVKIANLIKDQGN